MTRRLFLLSDKTVSAVERSLNQMLLEARLSWAAVDAGFDSWLRETLNPDSATQQSADAALGFLLSPRILEMRGGGRDEIEQVLTVLEERASHRTVLFSNMFADTTEVMPLTGHARLMAAASDINSRLYEFSRSHSWFHVVDHAGLATREGTRQLTDRRFEAMAQMYFSPAGSRSIAKLWMRVLRAIEKPAAKVIVIDLDNTLWRGILGEDGAEGIEMSSAPGGWAFRRFQMSLLQLKSNGVLLAISSKNNPEEVQRILAEHPDCIVRPGDFCAMEVGWGPKSESLRRMSARLRLGLDAFVFLDDSAFEREEVKQALPQVTVLDFPEDPTNLVEVLSEAFAFDSLRITQEDTERAESYVAEARRDALKEAMSSSEDFYRSLELKLQLFRATDAHADRLHQLILKTNQFNLTTERLTPEAFRTLLSLPEALVIGMRVSDKFGDSGITGLAIISGVGSDVWVVDNFLLSCRVIGRTVENAFLAWLADRARRDGARRIVVRFRQSGRNQVARDFLERSGLQKTDTEEQWELPSVIETSQLAPYFVEVEDRSV